MEHYKIEILSTADQDIIEIARYISEELKNPTAAETLIDKIYDAAESLFGFPYSHMLYYPVDKSKSLKHEYRKIPVDNYLLFYYVDEKSKSIVVSRVIYAKRNLTKQLK